MREDIIKEARELIGTYNKIIETECLYPIFIKLLRYLEENEPVS